MTQLTAPSKGCGLLLSCPSWRELRMQMTWTLRYQTEYLFRRACEYAMSQGVEADAEKAVHCTDYRFAKLWYLCRFHSIWILVNDDLKILHYLTSLCESAGFIGQSTTKSRLRVRGLDAAKSIRLFSSRIWFGKTSQISECQWHHFADLPPQPAAKSAKATWRSHKVSLLFRGMNSNLNCHYFKVFKRFLDCFWIQVLTRSDTFWPSQATFEKVHCRCFQSIVISQDSKVTYKPQKFVLGILKFGSCWNLDALVFLKCSHGGPLFAFLVATGADVLAAKICIWLMIYDLR